MEWIVGLAPFLMVLGIIWIVSNRKIEEKRLKYTAESSAEKAAQYAGNMKALEERVQVLERIITDRGYDVATQIEALRDTKRVEESGSGVPLDTGSRERV